MTTPWLLLLPVARELMLLPLEEQWVQRGFAAGELLVIPKTVHFSRLYFHQENWQFPPVSRLLVPDFLILDSSV